MIKRSQLVDILETEYCFRDYRILPARYFRKINKIGVHFLLSEADDVHCEIDDAIGTFSRDGFPHIYFYLKVAS